MSKTICEFRPDSPVFKVVRENGMEYYLVDLYEAVSLTYSDQAKEAIELLKTELQNETVNSASLEWQLILSYLANDQGEKAKAQLKSFLKHNDGYQQENAEALQKDLNRIWR